MSKMRLRMEAESRRPQELPTLQNAAGCSPEGVIYKLCKRGHVKSPENTKKNGSCKTCAIEIQRTWRLQNTEKLTAYSKKNWAVNREKETEKHRKWRGANPEKVKERETRFKENHKNDESLKERIRSRAKIWTTLNRERHNRNGKRWLSANFEKARSLRNQNARINHANLSDGAVSKMLKLPKSRAIPELIELKRAHIQLKREIKNANC